MSGLKTGATGCRQHNASEISGWEGRERKSNAINMSDPLPHCEGFGLDVTNRVMQEYQEIGFAKTASKKILGSMNQLAFEYEVLIEQKEGLENVKILEMNRDINRTILKGTKFLHPIDALKKLLKDIYQ